MRKVLSVGAGLAAAGLLTRCGVEAAPFVLHLACPLAGLVVFRILSGHRVGGRLWRPLVIALAAAAPPFAGLPMIPFQFAGFGIPLAEVGRSCLLLALMLWTVHIPPVRRYRASSSSMESCSALRRASGQESTATP